MQGADVAVAGLEHADGAVVDRGGVVGHDAELVDCDAAAGVGDGAGVIDGQRAGGGDLDGAGVCDVVVVDRGGTLFPYTTLFRYRAVLIDGQHAAGQHGDGLG